MHRLRVSLTVAMAIGLCQAAFAQDASTWMGAPDCRFAAIKPELVQAVTWQGGCKNGYANGKGVLEWRSDHDKSYKLDATMIAGQVDGEVTVHYANGTVYTGTLAQGMPEGHGYFRYTDGSQYEGDIRHGKPDGSGEMLYVAGNNYKGQWKDGKRQGMGSLTYILGGRYEGNWRDDKPSGVGKIVYAGEPAREAVTVDGHATDHADNAAVKPGRTYVVKHNDASVGSLIRQDAALAVPVPPALGYEQLTADQQALVNSWFPALAPGDEPPYPLHGPAEFYKFASTVTGKLRQRGQIRLYVTVDEAGKGNGVTAIGLDDPEARKLLATAAALVNYKPARCAGKPCTMVYGYNLALTLSQ